MKNQKPDHNSVVAKDNALIGQMAKYDLSELRLIAFCLAHYDSRVSDNRIFKARVQDLCEIFPMNPKYAYDVVRKVMIGLGKKPLEFKEGDRWKYRNWFSGFDYIEKKGEIEFIITPEMSPYLLKLKGNFTRYRLRDVYQFRAASTWKLYELLRRWANTVKWVVDLDKLRLLLGVAGKYSIWGDFRNRIIDSGIKEINELSDLRVSYEKTKRGRKISGLVFFIEIKQPDDEEIITVESKQDILFKSLLSYGLNEKTARDYIHQIERKNKTESILEKLPQMARNAKLKKAVMAKYITGAIKQELYQGNLYDELSEPPDHKEALDCWTTKRHNNEKCKVRRRGKPGQRKKCQICFDQLPIDTFGV